MEVNESTINKLVADVAALTADVQSAKQTAQQIAQATAQDISALKQQISSSVTEKEVGETGMAERYQVDNAANSAVNNANVKRTADQAQTVDLAILKQHQDLYNSVYTQSLTNLTQLNGVMAQAMQNAVAAADLHLKNVVQDAHEGNKQRAEHSDLSHDSLWNPVSAGAGMNLTAGAAPAVRMTDTAGAVATGAITADMSAIVSAVAKSFDATITPVMAVLQQVVALLTAQNAASKA